MTHQMTFNRKFNSALNILMRTLNLTFLIQRNQLNLTVLIEIGKLMCDHWPYTTQFHKLRPAHSLPPSEKDSRTSLDAEFLRDTPVGEGWFRTWRLATLLKLPRIENFGFVLFFLWILTTVTIAEREGSETPKIFTAHQVKLYLIVSFPPQVAQVFRCATKGPKRETCSSVLCPHVIYSILTNLQLISS